jgi:hypothetical protein
VLLSDGKNDVNENSIVAKLQYGEFRMLFTGDAGFETEARLLMCGVDLHADVLKVGHHGSAYASSPAFLAAVRRFRAPEQWKLSSIAFPRPIRFVRSSSSIGNSDVA